MKDLQLPPRPKNRELSFGKPLKWESLLLAIVYVLACALFGAWISQ